MNLSMINVNITVMSTTKNDTPKLFPLAISNKIIVPKNITLPNMAKIIPNTLFIFRFAHFNRQGVLPNHQIYAQDTSDISQQQA